MEASWLSKCKFDGPVARCFLDELTANVMTRSGSVVLAPMAIQTDKLIEDRAVLRIDTIGIRCRAATTNSAR